MSGGRPWFRMLALVLGFAFLYVPIVSLVVFSFNESRLVTVWGGFSTKWYGALLDNQQILGAALLSLQDRRHLGHAGAWCSARWPAWRWRASGRSAAARCSPA